MVWVPSYTPTFERDFKNLSQENRQRVEKAVREILASEDPRKLGRTKYGKWEGAYSYDIGMSIRVLYYVQSKEIVFLRCGYHQIYRK